MTNDNTYSLTPEECAEEILGDFEEDFREMVTFGHEYYLANELKF